MADTQPTVPRGIRNNNPLNLRISNNPWLGKVTTNTDGSFEQFISMQFGIRAAMRNYKTILARDIKRTPTIAALIHRWAPSSDGNNEQAYCNAVYDVSLIKPAEKLDWKNKNQTCRLLWAMAKVECGQLLPFHYFENAYVMAFGANSRNK